MVQPSSRHALLLLAVLVALKRAFIRAELAFERDLFFLLSLLRHAAYGLLLGVRNRALRGPKHPTWSAGWELRVAAARQIMAFGQDYLWDNPEGYRTTSRIFKLLAWPVYKVQGLLLHRTELAVPSSSGNPLVLCDVWSHQALPAAGPKFAVVYVHGGGMAVGNRVSAGPFSALLLNSACQLRTDVCVVTVEYILSTEKRFPGSLDDCLDVCRHLSARGVKVVLAGDSGGGGLVASTVLALRSEAQHSVIGAFLISPMLDQTHDRVYSARLSEFDIIQGRLANGTSRQYVESSVAAAHDVLASPVKCKDLRGLPPLLFHVGELEIFYDDAVEFHKNAVQSGVDCTLVAFPGMCHCFQLLAMDLPQAQESVKLFGDFCVKCWERSAAAEQLGSQPAAAWA